MIHDILYNIPVSSGSLTNVQISKPAGCDEFFADYLQLGDRDENQESYKRYDEIYTFVSRLMRETIGTGISLEQFIFEARDWTVADSHKGIRLPSHPIHILTGVTVQAVGEEEFTEVPITSFDVWRSKGILLLRPDAVVPNIDRNKEVNIKINVSCGYSEIESIPSTLLHIGLRLVREWYTDHKGLSQENNYLRTQSMMKRIRYLAASYVKYRI